MLGHLGCNRCGSFVDVLQTTSKVLCIVTVVSLNEGSILQSLRASLEVSNSFCHISVNVTHFRTQLSNVLLKGNHIFER